MIPSWLQCRVRKKKRDKRKPNRHKNRLLEKKLFKDEIIQSAGSMCREHFIHGATIETLADDHMAMGTGTGTGGSEIKKHTQNKYMVDECLRLVYCELYSMRSRKSFTRLRITQCNNKNRKKEKEEFTLVACMSVSFLSWVAWTDLFAWRTAHKFSETDKLNILSHIFVICWVDQNLDSITCSTKGDFAETKATSLDPLAQNRRLNERERKKAHTAETVLLKSRKRPKRLA